LIDTAVGARERGWAVARASRCAAAGGRERGGHRPADRPPCTGSPVGV